MAKRAKQAGTPADRATPKRPKTPRELAAPSKPSPKPAPKGKPKAKPKPPRKPRPSRAKQSGRPPPPKPKAITPFNHDDQDARMSLAFAAAQLAQAAGPDGAPEREWPGVTDPYRRRALDVIAHTSNATQAMEYVGFDRSTLHKVWLQDPAFAEAYRLALDIALDDLEGEAFRIAKYGTAEPKFADGLLVGVVMKQDTALMRWFLSNRRRDRWGGKDADAETKAAPAPVIIQMHGMIDEGRIQLSKPQPTEGDG